MARFAGGYERGMSNEQHHSPEPAPHDDRASEPLGPVTPDDETPLGDSPEAHDEIVPQDLPKGHPGRAEADRQAREGDGFARGNV
jgi:hypothetical protein